MRWFLRRLGFYVFATWVALTLTFLLPSLMPGDPIGGILQHLCPRRSSRTRESSRPTRHSSAAVTSRSGTPTSQYLHRVAHLDFGISTSNYPAPVSEVVGAQLPYSIVLVGIAFLLAFVLGTAIGMVAAWRRGGGFDTFLVPGLHGARRIPRVLHRRCSACTSSG